MLVKHSVAYLFARGLPGLINLAALVLFTHLLTPEAYGKYALVITGVGFGYAILFQWLQAGILRFYPAYIDREREFLVSILIILLVILAIFTLLAVLSFIFVVNHEYKPLYVAGIAVLWFWASSWCVVQMPSTSRIPVDRSVFSGLPPTSHISTLRLIHIVGSIRNSTRLYPSSLATYALTGVASKRIVLWPSTSSYPRRLKV